MSPSSIVFVLIIVQASYVLTLPGETTADATFNFTDASTQFDSTSIAPSTVAATTSIGMTSEDTSQFSTGTNKISSEITTNVDTTMDSGNSTDTPSTESKKNLPLILGLTLGLGLPASLGIIGGLVYYFKIYRPGLSKAVTAGR